MINSEYGIVVVYLTTHRPNSTNLEKIIHVPLKQNCCDPWNRRGDNRNVRAERGEGERERLLVLRARSSHDLGISGFVA